MDANWLRRGLLIALMLAGGVVLARVWLRPADVTPLVAAQPAVVLRPLDLLVQLSLMLVCALGIRAILPGDDEQGDSADGANR